MWSKHHSTKTCEIKMCHSKEIKLKAKPIRNIRDKNSGKVVARQYKWNTGDLEVIWTDDISRNVYYEDIVEVSSKSTY